METNTLVAPDCLSQRRSEDSLRQLEMVVEDVLAKTKFIDMHTHLFPPDFQQLNLWGIDELLTYHYLEAEFFRSAECSYEKYWSLSKPERADAISQALFVENSPLSEATRGVAAVLSGFGLSGALDEISNRQLTALSLQQRL